MTSKVNKRESLWIHSWGWVPFLNAYNRDGGWPLGQRGKANL